MKFLNWLLELLNDITEWLKSLFDDGNGSLPPVDPPDPPLPPSLPYLIDIENLPANNIIVKVNSGKIPLREWSRSNAKGFPVWGIFGKSIVKNRIIAKLDKLLVVWKDPIKGDGGKYAYELANGQIVDGTYIYTDNTGTHEDVNISTFSSPKRTRLYILEEHVDEV
jgi:hypothetical protein